MRFNKKDYEKAEQFFNGETKWRDTWAEEAMSKVGRAFDEQVGEQADDEWAMPNPWTDEEIERADKKGKTAKEMIRLGGQVQKGFEDGADSERSTMTQEKWEAIAGTKAGVLPKWKKPKRWEKRSEPFVKMSVADYGKIKRSLLGAVQADVSREIFSDHTVGALPRAKDILKLLCDIEVTEDEG